MIHKLLQPGKKAGRRFLALSLICGILITGCANGEGAEGLIPASAGDKWIDSEVMEFVEQSGEARIQDDFALAATKEYMLDEDNRGLLNDVYFKVLDKKRACLEDTALQTEGMDEVRKYADLAEDWDYRNSQGAEPLRKYIEAIDAISDLDSLFKWMNSPEENPLGKAPVHVAKVEQSPVDPTVYMTYLDHGTLSLGTANNYYFMGPDVVILKENVDKKVTLVLEQLGYDSSYISSVINGSFRTEKKIAGNVITLTEDDLKNISYSRYGLKEAVGGYPLFDYLEAWGYGEAQRFFIDIGYARQLERLFSEDGVSDLKDYLIVQYILSNGDNLDQETSKAFHEIDRPTTEKSANEKQELDKETEANVLLFSTYLERDSMIGAAFNKAYLEKYADPSCVDRLHKMTEDIIETYHDIFNNESWLSDEGKALFIEKLDAIKIHIIYPDDEDLDLSEVNIVSREDGGTFLDAVMEAQRAYNLKRSELSTKAFDRGYWDPYDAEITTTVTNAFYNSRTNGIYIMAGIVDDPLFYPDMPDEELYAGIGVVVGHEITHGFDVNGVRYDKDGLERSWVPDEDTSAFIDKSGKVGKFYSTLTPFPGSGLYPGSNVEAEATADMGGLRVTLEMAKKIPEFDFDKYFRFFALMFMNKSTLEREKSLLSIDVHPLGFYRVNVGLMQFEEFYETYNIQPGDGMYLEESKRIAVW